METRNFSIIQSQFIRSVVAIVLLTSTNIGLAEEATNKYLRDGDSKFNLSFATGVSSGNSTAQFKVRTPLLGKVDPGKFFSGEYYLTAGAGTYWLKGIAVAGESKLENLYGDYISLGLRVEHDGVIDSQNFYGHYEVLHFFAKDEIMADPTYAGRIGFGSTFALPTQKNLWGKDVNSELFIQGELTLGANRADKIPGEPDLFNGVGVTVGVISHL